LINSISARLNRSFLRFELADSRKFTRGQLNSPVEHNHNNNRITSIDDRESEVERRQSAGCRVIAAELAEVILVDVVLTWTLRHAVVVVPECALAFGAVGRNY